MGNLAADPKWCYLCGRPRSECSHRTYAPPPIQVHQGEPCPVCATLRADLARVTAEREDALYAKNLLAVIHRDGGHYTDKHGIRKSTDDAMQRVNDRAVALDRAESDLARVREALGDASTALEVAARNIYEAAQIIKDGGNGDWQIVEATHGEALLSAQQARAALGPRGPERK